MNYLDTINKEIKEYFKSLLDSRKFLIQTILSDININLEYENGSYNVALYSEYGSGKSYFLNSLKEFISDEKLRAGENFDLDTNFKIIEINAWKDDFLDDPILSIGFALKKEIEADIVHYQEKNIFFYVYDKKKIIKETKNFNDYFNKQFDRKTVKLFVLQPVKL